ncbi:MAG: GNAT family N-acetyltransferase [Terriglobia bacterium]
MIRGEEVELRPMTLDEVPAFYESAIKCSFWYGEHSDEPIPTYEKFREDFRDYLFDGSNPSQGRAYSILAGNQAVGEINYEIHDGKEAEIDILIFEEANRGKGLGPDALAALSDWLFLTLGARVCFIEHVSLNQRAIRASEKAGFERQKEYFEGDYKYVRLEKANPKRAAAAPI